MKVVFPKNIKKGLLAGMSISMGPITLSLIQLFLIAIGIASGIGIFNAISKTGSKAMGIIIALPIIGIFIILAFFKISELGILAFISKIIRNNFLDITKKYQTNYTKFNPITIIIQKSKWKKKIHSMQRKKETNTNKLINELDHSGLL